MYKIFKYRANLVDQLYHVTLPKSAVVIRCGYVNDGFYEGFFTWAIVEPEDKTCEPRFINPCSTIIEKPDNCKCDYLGIIEEQVLSIPNPPKYVEIDDYGFPLVYYEYANKELEKFKVIARKTGQEIGYDPDQLTYLGMLKIWIKQELGAYVFLVKE